MVANTAQDHPPESVKPPTAGAGQAYGRRIGRALLDVIELEVQIITLRLLSAMRDAMVRACLAAAGVVLGIAGLVFLEIALFHALERSIPILWVFVIFAAAHFLLAGIAVFMAYRPIKEGRTGKSVMASAPDKHGGRRL